MIGPTGRKRRPPLERFAEKCRFEPHTGCVVWIGGKTSGQGGSKGVYGAFRDGDTRWFAHRWSAHHIHGFDINGLQVDHYCPALLAIGARPNTLCVEHVQTATLEQNVALQHARRRETQTNLQRQFWLMVHRGWEELPPQPETIDLEQIPFFAPPAWLQPFTAAEREAATCPF